MRVTVATLAEKKRKGEKITVLTAYDYLTAKLLDRAGVDAILVGDSLAMVALGYPSTVQVTMEEMIHHTKAVVRGRERALVIFDMPFLSYQTGERDAVLNAGRALKETGCDAVKVEGGKEMAGVIRAITEAGIPVIGHVGLQPQSVNLYGGYRLRGRTKEERVRILEDAKAVEEAGAVAVVLEKIPADLAKEITESLSIPTIGIGAGPFCDGQVLVFHDLVGLFTDFKPKFVKRYAELGREAEEAVKSFIKEVQEGKFPGEEHSY
ncbi:3-methyl-2-oxobutanoate hydroxymethyltransferase [Thermovibrio ammonificans]|jgi:3-methyl-2-oxobutanoate hydroxymethyltransferase|uniref:3-methyl-2-oxobutanoate hydroxymethyltransferase n=1 Tax=Thermovibrio ammonificans (strain DSM 15698 / JCM 12110 / HB-1) TaxID=648996 RepID=E8T692_THEA1|nr:3-methyl-2-oxobutanoate hydroxymethyltransferase [Thermovibrio ammonificans]ADU96676.1 3-methyl-2-oxobutanoate hydroxymethyltransferase [Thermovibrio ammonificans HB-1]